METDKTTITVSIPTNLVIDLINERIDTGKTMDNIVEKALLDHYYKLFTGGDTNGSEG